jgi:hypothetical protein
LDIQQALFHFQIQGAICVISSYEPFTGNEEISSRCTMSLWCLNPAVVFQEIADRTLSVILTSG